MHKIIEEELEAACGLYRLSSPTCVAIKALISRKLDGEISGADLVNNLERVYDLIKEDMSHEG
jgi:hypothetical protein